MGIALAMTSLIACSEITGASDLNGGPTEDIPLRERRPLDDEAGVDTTTRSPTDPPHDRGVSSDSGTTSTSDAAFDSATAAPPSFIDTFARADGPAIGNAWTEKQDRFALAGGAVVQSGTGTYIDWFVSRPAAEVSRDVQLSVDFTYGSNPDSDPTLYARVQPSSSAAGVLSGYTFYAYTDWAGIDREDGKMTTDLAGAAIAPALVVGKTYHYVFRVTGTDPVRLEATITDGSNTVATLSASDGDAKRVVNAGTVAFGSGKADRGRWDDFERTDL